MFEFGKEEPMANNESLYEKKVGVDELLLDRSKGRKLNRYSFVGKGEGPGSVALLVRELLGQLGLRVVVIVSWPNALPGRSAVATKVIGKRYFTQGWNVHSRGDHYIAVKEAKLSEPISCPPFGVDTAISGFLLLAGDGDEENMLNVISEDCSSFLARMRYFVPDGDFFKKLELSDTAALYQVNDHINNVGIVFLSKRVISVHRVNNINVGVEYEGDSAYKVFS